MRKIQIDIPFYYLGERDYVNGLTLFEEMLKAYLVWINQPYTWIEEVEIFRINRFVRNACRLEIYLEKPPDREIIPRAAARMRILTADAQRVHLLLMEKESHPVMQRLEDYDRGQYLLSKPDGSLPDAGATRICRITDVFTLTRAVVEANYRYCCQVASDMKVSSGVSWAYLNRFRYPPVRADHKSPIVCFSEGPTITLPKKIFLVRYFRFEGHPTAQPTEIGFFFDLEPDR